jgi:D-lactate dehydrogenase (cytochrome)
MNIRSLRRPLCPLAEELQGLLGERLSLAPAVREQHGQDTSYHPAAAPDAVAFARSTEEVVAIVRLAGKHEFPIIPFGSGTSLEGQVAALAGGICIDLSQMNRILEVNAGDLDARVEAGVRREQLDECLRERGLFFPVGPGVNATLGGMAATRASGTNAVRYGTMRENVFGLTVVLADGKVIRTGGRARKSAAGYDLTRLFVGSEGTLGVITEVALRLYGLPEAISAAVAGFPSLGAAVDSAIETIQRGIPIARVELMDEVQLDACNRFAHLDYPVQPTLFFEFHGSAQGVVEQAEAVQAIAAAHGAGAFLWAVQEQERKRLWQARHDALYAALALRPGARVYTTDVCVPITRLADCILQTRQDLDVTGLLSPIVGHVGDGNFHLAMLLDPANAAEIALAHRVNDRLVERALALGGTCSGEHGIGSGKIACLEAEHGEAVDTMRLIKRALDPDNRMNPGKVLRWS